MKPFDFQRYLMGFLLPGAQPPSAHSLSQPSLQPAVRGAGGSTGAQLPWWQVSLPHQCCGSPHIFRAHAPACHVVPRERQNYLFVCKPQENPTSLNWHLRATLIPSQKVKLLFLVACWCSEGKAAPVRSWPCSPGVLVICWEQPDCSYLPSCGAGSIAVCRLVFWHLYPLLFFFFLNNHLRLR